MTIELVVRAQFGGPLDAFGALRRRRSEVEYPRYSGDAVTEAEASDTLTKARDPRCRGQGAALSDPVPGALNNLDRASVRHDLRAISVHRPDLDRRLIAVAL